MKTRKISKISVGGILPILLSIILLFAGGCRKAPINGDLDGQWQVMTIENADGSTVTPDNVFYCFNLHVAELTSGKGTVFANMTYSHPDITLDFPYVKSPAGLATWGLGSNPAVIKVISLSSKKLVMQSGETTVTCRKF